jgi:hypothetical protein
MPLLDTARLFVLAVGHVTDGQNRTSSRDYSAVQPHNLVLLARDYMSQVGTTMQEHGSGRNSPTTVFVRENMQLIASSVRITAIRCKLKEYTVNSRSIPIIDWITMPLNEHHPGQMKIITAHAVP